MKKTFPLLIITLIFLASCSRGEETAIKNLEEIYQEEGIPVTVRTVGREDFSTFISFTSSLTGTKESTGASMVSDTVEEVLVAVGDFVEKDQPLVRFPKDNPALGYYQAKAAYEAARTGFNRVENLYQSSGISLQAYDDTKTQYEVQSANWETVQDMVEVKSPIAGYVTRLNVQPSDNVNPGDDLFTVSNFDKLTATVWVADHEIKQISKGQSATAHWEDISISGEVTQVDLSMDPHMKAFAVYVSFNNEDHLIPSGITANIDIETSLTKDSIVLHRNEILSDHDEWYVYLNVNGTAKKQPVQPGIRQGMYYVLESGLNGGEELVTRGASLIREDSSLKIVE
ncbi:MAG: efflux RND transporter periplasmic adaptor subunit [Spirochaetales bacterium]|nr:efflux RND transporter periplasmic adaptor subunit [Spirochaetales bacterium]